MRPGTIQSVERAVAVLKLFGEAEPDLGVSDLARRLRLHKSTVSRLLSTLEAGGFVQQDDRTGRYRLGLQLATLAGRALTQYDLRDVARPALSELAPAADETVALAVLDGDVAVNIDQVLAPNPVKHLGWIGRRLPLHCTAAGKPLLAYQPALVLDALLARPLARYTARTITDPALLRRELGLVRAQGFAVAQEEYEAELSAVGAAVRNHRGEVVASITISGPTYRLGQQRLLELGRAVCRSAERVSALLGHRSAGAARVAVMADLGAAARLGGAPAGARLPAAVNGGASDARGAGAAREGRRPQVGVAGPLLGN